MSVEIDFYTDRNLIIAEVKFNSIKEVNKFLKILVLLYKDFLFKNI
jgi:hypothetical protein